MALDCAPVRAGIDQPLVILPRAYAGQRRDPGSDASDRRAVPGDTRVRLAADGATPAAYRLVRGTSSSPPPDDQDGLGADLSAAKDQRAASAAQDSSVPAASPDDRPDKPGLVWQHHLHPNATRLPLSGRDPGLGEPESPGLAAGETHG